MNLQSNYFIYNIYNKIFIFVLNIYILLFDFSVIRLIQQYLKESNLVKTLQTLQVLIYYFYIYFYFINEVIMSQLF